MNLSEVTYPKDTKNRVQTLLVEEANRTSRSARNWLEITGIRARTLQPLGADAQHGSSASRGESNGEAQAQKLSQPKRIIRRTILVSGAAAVLAGGLVASDVIHFGGNTIPSTAHAAELLNRAADSVIATTDPAVGPGQYLRLDTAESTINASENGLMWTARSDNQLFVPYDRNGEWVLNLGPLEPAEYFGAATEEKVENYYRSKGLQSPEPGRQLRGLGGTVVFSANSVTFGNLSPTEEATIPREPAALVDWIKAEIKGTDASVWSFIAGQLATGVVPAEWRAALYRAAALVPGAIVTEQQITLDGRSGTAVGRTEDGVRTDVIFDPASGLFIGMRAVNETGNSIVPAGTTTAWTSVRTSVVDSID
ncbi:RNA polymerase sigma-70 factor (ECF subfamily) [Arthrobacter sp. 1088]|uniref:CU044_5270 family protein n=1 Tax=Arthrobacter sp. 1088 TaxID=2817768 RepID=UPI00285D3180|nr:CU044_5270 family protein [Arthrobacter sp. 1088]MDR6685775.1 RNA polymerase sigma-70 factor (ECF subfamily) [Arthrobacter sp. 1088]